MIWLFVFVALTAVLMWKYRQPLNKFLMFTDKGFAKGDRLIKIILFIISFAPALVFGHLFSNLSGIFIPQCWVEKKTENLITMRGGSGIHGQFFLGCGSIGTEPYYFFYKKIEGGYQLGRIKVTDDVIVEEKRQDGELKTYVSRFVNPSFRWIARENPIRKYKFIIPENSIKRGFALQ